MADTTVSVRVDEQIHEQMKLHDEINWSAIVRKSIIGTLDRLGSIDQERAKKAMKDMDEIRRMKVFDGGKPAGEIIREWRDKRK